MNHIRNFTNCPNKLPSVFVLNCFFLPRPLYQKLYELICCLLLVASCFIVKIMKKNIRKSI